MTAADLFVEEFHARALAAGLRPDGAPRDAPWGERFFHLTDPDGHELSFAMPLPGTATGPPPPGERDAPARAAERSRSPPLLVVHQMPDVAAAGHGEQPQPAAAGPAAQGLQHRPGDFA